MLANLFPTLLLAAAPPSPDAPTPPVTGPAESRSRGAGSLIVSGNLQRDLIRLGLVPCAAVAIALSAWFTHSRLATLDATFDAEGEAVAREVAALSDLSLHAGDVQALQNVASAALQGGQVSRVEISNSAGVYVTAGSATAPMKQLRIFTVPVTMHEAPKAGGDAPIGLVQTFRDTTAHSRERIRSLMAGIGIALVALLAAWASVRHMARAVASPLRRVSRTVAALEAGDFDARCDVVGRSDPAQGEDVAGARGTYEVANLTRDINRLAERLQRNQQLSEERVREPTALMGALLDDLLEISRLDARVLTPAITTVSLDMLFDQLEVQCASQAAKAQVRIVWRDRGHAVRSDPALLLRVVGNLVSNAVGNAPADSPVLVLARRRANGRVRIEVRDGGGGIAPIHQTRIFEEFYQVANTGRNRRQGFGLGLAICARIAALLGTRIGVRSALRRGSTFSLDLPAADPVDVAPPAPEPPAPVGLAHLRCLVVDDDPVLLKSSRALLEQWGCKVACVMTRSEAVARLGAPGVRFDVVLCDQQLAGEEDGMTVIDATRKLQPEALAVLASGATAPEVLQRLRRGGVMLLSKPVAPAKLRALLSTRRHAT